MMIIFSNYIQVEITAVRKFSKEKDEWQNEDKGDAVAVQKIMLQNFPTILKRF